MSLPKVGQTIKVSTTDRNRVDKPTTVRKIITCKIIVTDDGLFYANTGYEVGRPSGKRCGWDTED